MKVIIVMLVFDRDDRRWSETCDHSWQPTPKPGRRRMIARLCDSCYFQSLLPASWAPRTTQSRGNTHNQGGKRTGLGAVFGFFFVSSKHACLLYNRLYQRINSRMAKTRAAVIIHWNISQHLPIKFPFSIVSLFSISCVFTAEYVWDNYYRKQPCIGRWSSFFINVDLPSNFAKL